MDGLMKYINRTTRCSNFFRAQQLADSGISGVQCVYLLRVGHNPGISQDQLADSCIKTKAWWPGISRLCSRQAISGANRRPNDRRVQQLYLTDKATELLPRIFEVFSKWEEILTRGFTEQEREQALNLLTRIYMNAEAEIQRETSVQPEETALSADPYPDGKEEAR